ncbi:MAG TPA: plasmid pRiA4b ORF-3 family protein [Longimicrobiales bacterium]
MNRRSNPRDAIRLRISLAEIEPSIWREVLVSRDTTLHELHRGIQVLFDWYDYHLYEFDIGGRRFEAPDEEAEGEDATKAKLRNVVEGPGHAFRYTYDFGDHWVHRIEVLEMNVRADPDWLPYLVDGARSGPPEDCGGVFGYFRLLEALRTPYEDLDEEGRTLVDWAGPDYDPEEFSVEQARHALLLCGA